MTEALAPMTPADCDLRGFPFTPLFRARLFGSSFHARSTDAEWRAGVTLWLKSWDQVPTGSLPDDEVDLCRLAELGRDLKAWRKVQEGAMRGWVKCSDGRFYHAVVAEGVNEAWQTKVTASAKGKAGASKRWSPGTAQALPQAMPQPSTDDAPAIPWHTTATVLNGSGNAPTTDSDSNRTELKGTQPNRESQDLENKKDSLSSDGAVPQPRASLQRTQGARSLAAASEVANPTPNRSGAPYPISTALEATVARLTHRRPL